MSSSDFRSTGDGIIEHIVLFKAKPEADPSVVSAWISEINALASLDSVLFITAGPISRCYSDSFAFTHMIHSRYRTRADLYSYANDPAHLGVIDKYSKDVVDDIMAVDWSAGDLLSGREIPPPGSSVRATILKPNESADGDEILRQIRRKSDSIEQVTVGKNFSLGRNKGYSICSVAIHRGSEELGSGLEDVKDLIDGYVVSDYVFRTSPPLESPSENSDNFPQL